MPKFKIIEEFEPNPQMLEILKDFEYETKNGVSKAILKTNLEVVEPITYQITNPVNLTILEYRVNEISNKPFYIKDTREKHNLKEIKQLLTKFSQNSTKMLVDIS